MTKRRRILDVSSIAIVAVGILGLTAASPAHATTTYTWTGGDGAGSHWYDVGNWAGGSVPAFVTAQLSTPDSTDTVVFDSETVSYMPTDTVYTRSSWTDGNKNPKIELRNGTLKVGSGENWGWSGINTLVVGDGDMTTAAILNSAWYNLNRDPGGTKTYVVNADGTFNVTRNITSWSSGSAKDAVIRLVGGTMTVDGYIGNYLTDDSGDYVTFEAAGSSFTAKFGGSLPDIATVKAEIGATKSFRPSGLNVAAKDNGDTTFTVYIDSTPPTLLPSDIVDDKSGGSIIELTPVTYSVTFSEAMDTASIIADNFTNSAVSTPSPIDIGPVTQVNATNFTVVVTPTDGGNLRLQVSSNVTDLAGNLLIANVDDDTTIVVTDDVTAPTVSSIVDSAGGTAEEFQQLTYTVTFSKDLDATTVDLTDFTNALDAIITIDSVNPGVNTNVLIVAVTPQTVGSLQFRVKAGSVADLSGNVLAFDADDDDTITVNADTTAPTLVGSNFADDVDGGPITPGTAVSYTVTFSEDMDSATVSSADFGNAGGASITVGTVTETTVNSGVFTVPVTPTSAGTLQLQVNQNAVLNDVAGNPLDTSSAILDDTTIVVDGTVPTLSNSDIVDNRIGGPIGKGIVVTYTLTFSESMDMNTVIAGAFSNAGSSSITVGAISQVDTNIFTVEVTPTDAGSLQLQVASSVTDLAGNALASAVTDDTAITVEATVIYSWTGAVDGDWNNIGNWEPNGVPPTSGGTVSVTPGETILFNALGSSNPLPTSNIPGLPGRGYGMPSIDLLYGGEITFAGTTENWSQPPNIDMGTVGDGDLGNGTVTLNYSKLTDLRRDPGGTASWVINADGSLNFTRSTTFLVCYGGGKYTTFTINGGAVEFNGALTKIATEANTYAEFTAPGSSFTAKFGGDFADKSAVEAQIGSGLSFRSSTGQTLGATDNGDGTFTVDFPPPSGTLIIVR